MQELKPCPFCGKQPKIAEFENSGIKTAMIYCDSNSIHCVRPKTRIHTLHVVTQEWNRRQMNENR